MLAVIKMMASRQKDYVLVDVIDQFQVGLVKNMLIGVAEIN